MYRKGLVKKIKVNCKLYDVTAWSTNAWNTHITQYFQSISYIQISTKKNRHSIFLKEILPEMLFKIPLWRQIDNITSYILICSKTLKVLYLSFCWFNDSHGFELLNRGFELITCGFELVTPGFGILTFGFEIALLNFTSCFYSINLCFYLWTRNS